MKNGRCRLHGGKSTGPRTPEGLERSRRARWKHGRYSREAKEAAREARWSDPVYVEAKRQASKRRFERALCSPLQTKAASHGPQLSFWMWYTIVFGARFGIVAAAIARRRGTAAG